MVDILQTLLWPPQHKQPELLKDNFPGGMKDAACVSVAHS